MWKRRLVRTVCVVLGLLLVATGCTSNPDKPTDSQTAGQTTVAGEGTSGSGAENTENTENEERTTNSRGYGVYPLLDFRPSKQTVQTIGYEGGILEQLIQSKMGFSKAQPREDNLVFTEDLQGDGYEPYTDGLGREVRPIEQFFFPVLNDTSPDAQIFNDGIAEEIRKYAEALAFHAAENSTVRMGVTYRTYLYDGYLSIVILQWMEQENLSFVTPSTVVYDLVRREFLSKERILKDLELDVKETTELFDMWYAEGETRVLDGYDYKRDLAQPLLELWTDAYDLFEGSEWKNNYLERRERARNYHYTGFDPMEFYAPYFIDDEGKFCMIKTSFVTKGANENGLLPGSAFVPEYTSSFDQALRSDNKSTPSLGFQQLAKLTGTEGQDIDAYLIHLGKNTDAGAAAKMLETLNALEGLSVIGFRTLEMRDLGGELDYYAVVTKYENAVIGTQRHEPRDATVWQNYWKTLGYAFVVMDGESSEIHVVHRDRHGIAVCEKGKIRVQEDGARLFDATEWVLPSEQASPETQELIDLFAPKG